MSHHSRRTNTTRRPVRARPEADPSRPGPLPFGVGASPRWTMRPYARDAAGDPLQHPWLVRSTGAGCAARSAAARRRALPAGEAAPGAAFVGAFATDGRRRAARRSRYYPQAGEGRHGDGQLLEDKDSLGRTPPKWEGGVPGRSRPRRRHQRRPDERRLCAGTSGAANRWAEPGPRAAEQDPPAVGWFGSGSSIGGSADRAGSRTPDPGGRDPARPRTQGPLRRILRTRDGDRARTYGSKLASLSKPVRRRASAAAAASGAPQLRADEAALAGSPFSR